MVFRFKRNLCILVHKHVVMSIRYLEFELFMSLCLRFVSQEEKNLVKCFKAIEKIPNINALNSSNQLYNEEKKMLVKITLLIITNTEESRILILLYFLMIFHTK